MNLSASSSIQDSPRQAKHHFNDNHHQNNNTDGETANRPPPSLTLDSPTDDHANQERSDNATSTPMDINFLAAPGNDSDGKIQHLYTKIEFQILLVQLKNLGMIWILSSNLGFLSRSRNLTLIWIECSNNQIYFQVSSLFTNQLCKLALTFVTLNLYVT